MAIKIHLDDILKERNMTSKELCKKVHITEANLSRQKECVSQRSIRSAIILSAMSGIS
jgi:DNA-binding Xre family transcriptional regulator